jgi:hypothetical protein
MVPAPTIGAITSSKLASSHTIAADLPPSSSVTRRSRSPQSAAILRPAAVLPVKPTLSMPGCVTRYSPTSRPAGSDAHDALPDAGLVERVGEQVRVERRLGRRLHDDRAAGRERRARASA